MNSLMPHLDLINIAASNYSEGAIYDRESVRKVEHATVGIGLDPGDSLFNIITRGIGVLVTIDLARYKTLSYSR